MTTIYSVPHPLFLCTTILIAFFAAMALFVLIVWIFRTCTGKSNPDHMVHYTFLATYKVNMKSELKKEEDDGAISEVTTERVPFE